MVKLFDRICLMQPDNNPNAGPNPSNVIVPPTSPSGDRPGTKAAHKIYYLGASIIVLFLTVGAIYWLFKGSNTKKPVAAQAGTTNSPPKTPALAPSNLPGVQLDPTKNYGDKYSNGILPVGDGKYVTDSPKVGYVYACSNYVRNMQQAQGGAGRRGPWFVGTAQYDLNKKIHVQGSIQWQAQFSNKVSGSTRTIITNDLPDHTTGVFPISAADPAYAYDRNPNSIKGQALTYALSANPTYGNPNCVSGQVGIMLTGVALFSSFDAAGRDAGAWEIQDSCSGHPEKDGIYHYHTLSSCIKDTSVKTVIGFALDGYPITGPMVSANNYLTTSDLDECHGLTSQVVLDGKDVTTYHYVMTQDFPYSVSCYRSQAITPPGQNTAPKGA